VPFLIGMPMPGAAVVAASGTLAILFLVGMVVSLYSGRSALIGGLRLLAIGACALAATYGIGHLFGVVAT
jgi:VIT1/CCC1 family predicted Fe2+/Mn2+ transporter